jgi:hypothetical protein
MSISSTLSSWALVRGEKRPAAAYVNRGKLEARRGRFIDVCVEVLEVAYVRPGAVGPVIASA